MHKMVTSLQYTEGSPRTHRPQTAGCKWPPQGVMESPLDFQLGDLSWHHELRETSPGLKSPNKTIAPYSTGCHKLCGNLLKSTLQFKNIPLKRHKLSTLRGQTNFILWGIFFLAFNVWNVRSATLLASSLPGARHLLCSDPYRKLVFASTSGWPVGAKQSTHGWFGAEPGRQHHVISFYYKAASWFLFSYVATFWRRNTVYIQSLICCFLLKPIEQTSQYH